jgi:hypothetical protein
VAPNPTKSTRPTIDTGIEVYGDCTTPNVQPVEIVMSCADRGAILQGLHWTSWTSASAKAVGTLRYNDCTPSCANGQIHYAPDTRVTLTAPVRGAGGQLVWSLVQFSPRPPGWEGGPYHGGPWPLPTQPG